MNKALLRSMMSSCDGRFVCVKASGSLEKGKIYFASFQESHFIFLSKARGEEPTSVIMADAFLSHFEPCPEEEA